MATGSLPSYPEMILREIEALNKENGSNNSSISKYIESTYSGLPEGHKALLNLHLEKMRASGELVFWKNNYTKRHPNVPPRRGRGRPPKSKDPQSLGPVLSPLKLRSRGRPPKDPNGPPRAFEVKVSSGSDRPRGRPRKIVRPTVESNGTPTLAATGGHRPRGRPPKKKAPLP